MADRLTYVNVGSLFNHLCPISVEYGFILCHVQSEILPDFFFLQDVYRSGFFFIENAFYNDMRDPNNIDYSR